MWVGQAFGVFPTPPPSNKRSGEEGWGDVMGNENWAKWENLGTVHGK